MTVCLYLPDGRVAFMFGRPTITTTTPRCRRADVDDGRVPSRNCGSTTTARSSCSTSRRRWPTRRRRSRPTRSPSARPTSPSAAGPAQHVRRRARRAARGAGRGVRQGPLRTAGRRPRARSASATRSGRSTATGCATTRGARGTGRRRGTTAGSPPTSSADFGFMLSRIARRDGDGTRGGFVWEDGESTLCDDVTLSTEYGGRRPLPPTVARRAVVEPGRPYVAVHR